MTLPLFRLGSMSLLMGLSLSAAGAAERCSLVETNETPVTIVGGMALVPAIIDGTRMSFIVDTSAPYSLVSQAAAAHSKLPQPLVWGPETHWAGARSFAIFGQTFHHVWLRVDGRNPPAGAAGWVGQDLLGQEDVEYDFANGVMRFFKPGRCKGVNPAYWSAGQGVSALHLLPLMAAPADSAWAFVNGQRIQVDFDTEYERSLLSVPAAKRAGAGPGDSGVAPVTPRSDLWSAPITRLRIGDEEIEHSRVLVWEPGRRWYFDRAPDTVDMVLGVDFFLAHRIYFASRQREVYYTYNGGQIFNVSPTTEFPDSAVAPTVTLSGAPSARGGLATADAAAPIPIDAAGFLRRGLAYAARGEQPQSLADLTHAIGIEPHNAEYLYWRGMVRQEDPTGIVDALRDFDAAIRLDPQDPTARLARTKLELAEHYANVEGDLQALDRLIPPESDLRRDLGDLYHDSGQYAAAAREYDLWIEHHPQDPAALGTRCGLRAGADIELNGALGDCDIALAAQAKSYPAVDLSNRSLVYLRMGQLDLAIADDTAAIRLQANAANAFYIRGLAELRQGLTVRGQADLAAARKLQPGIDQHFAKMGLKR